MSQICTVTLCSRTARALCHCCQQNVCVIHLNEHNNFPNSRVHPFMDMIQSLNNRIQSIDISKIVDNYREKLQQWRVDSHRKIDEYFEQKDQELVRLFTEKIDEERDEITQVEIKLKKLIHERETNHDDIYELSIMIDYLERQIKTIEENFIDLRIRSLTLDNNLINIRGINEEVYDLSILSSVYRTIHRPDGSYHAFACNDRILLIHQAPNLCFINQELLIFSQIPWRYERIYDMCWSIALRCFILLTPKNVILLNEINMSLEKIKNLEKQKWLSCTCSDKYLFLSTNEWGSSIMKIDLLSSKKFDQQWQSKVCNKDESIDVLRYHKEKLALLIKNNSQSTTRMELRSSETLISLWSLTLDVIWNPNRPYHCNSFIGEDWLISDYESGRLLHITKTGKINSIMPYNTIPYANTLFGTHVLAVSTEDGVNFHNLNYRKTYTIGVL
ncbi:hypothetical protein I4U23_007271 [Adineta vaga]|nr:hypothetical protein I4U23_007271 [Adineta vaga]